MEQSTRKQIKQFVIRLRFITQTRLTRIQKETNATTKIIELSQAETETDTAKQRRSQNREERGETRGGGEFNKALNNITRK